MSAWYIYKDIFEECISQFEFAKKLMSGKILIYAKDESFSYHGSKILFDAGAEEVITWSKINQKNVLTKRMYADSKSIIVSNISENHLNDDYFDNIISLNTIQNTEPEFLVSCKKLLKNNGLFFISIQNSLVYPSPSKNTVGMTKDEFQIFLSRFFTNFTLYYQGRILEKKQSFFTKILTYIRKFLKNILLMFDRNQTFFELYFKKYLLKIYSVSEKINSSSNMTYSLPTSDKIDYSPTFFIAVCNNSN